jgi:hypothetical protein
MSTFTSIIPAAGTIPSFRQQKGNLPKGARTSLNAVRTNTTTYLTGKLARTDSSEKFISGAPHCNLYGPLLRDCDGPTRRSARYVLLQSLDDVGYEYGPQ